MFIFLCPPCCIQYLAQRRTSVNQVQGEGTMLETHKNTHRCIVQNIAQCSYCCCKCVCSCLCIWHPTSPTGSLISITQRRGTNSALMSATKCAPCVLTFVKHMMKGESTYEGRVTFRSIYFFQVEHMWLQCDWESIPTVRNGF